MRHYGKRFVGLSKPRARFSMIVMPHRKDAALVAELVSSSVHLVHILATMPR